MDLDEEQRTSAMLRAEIKTLQTEIVQKDKALASAARDREATVEKLGEAGTTVENNAQQLAVAKTKVCMTFCTKDSSYFKALQSNINFMLLEEYASQDL